MDEPTKRCARCKQEKPLSAYGRTNETDRHHKYQRYCRPCANAYQLQHHAERMSKGLPAWAHWRPSAETRGNPSA